MEQTLGFALNQKLIVPEIKWGAQWQTFKEATMSKLEYHTEQIVAKHRMHGRSRALLWCIAIPAFQSPRFAHDFEAINAGIRMYRKLALPEKVRPAFTVNEIPLSRLECTAVRWGWQKLATMVYKTSIGTIHLGKDSKATIVRAATLGWQLDMASRDNRWCHEMTGLSSLNVRVATGYHKKIYNSAEPWGLRAAVVGCLPVHKELNKSPCIKRAESHACVCGFAEPDRRHMA